MPPVEIFSITVPAGCKAKLRAKADAAGLPLTKFVAATLAKALKMPELADVKSVGKPRKTKAD